MVIKYDDFDLQIEPAGEKFRVRLLNAPTGQATSEFVLPFTEIEVSNFLNRIGQVRRTMRRVDAPELQAAKEFGGKLFNAVFSGEMIAQLRGSIEQASDQEHGLRIRLRLTDVPSLADLPWEFLYDANQNHFLTTSIETPVVRFLDLPQRIAPLRVALPLRVLVVIASPRNLKRLDTEGEWERLQESLGDLVQGGQIVLERLPKATLDALRLRARGAPFHVFHFIGHGGFDDAAQDGVVQFEDETGMSYPVRGELLGMQLHDHRSLRLAVLNACEGARSSRQDPFSGVAQSLLQQRVPAVIAMQFEISDAAAKVFAQEFYRAVAEGNPVDAAVCESRKALFKEEFGQEWATPVLYMRSEEGQLFELQAVAPPPSPDADQKRRQAEAEAAKAEAARQAAQKAAAERGAQLEKERLEREKTEADRSAAEKTKEGQRARAEKERLAREAAEKEWSVRQREEAERRASERATFERLQREKEEADRRAQAQAPGEAQDASVARASGGPGRKIKPGVWYAVAAVVLGLVIWFGYSYFSHRPSLRSPELHFQSAETLRSQRNFEAAVAEYREAIRLRPEYAAAHFGLGIALRDTGDLEAAITELREGIRERAQDSSAHDALALALFRKGDLDGAIAESREAARLAPGDAQAHYNLAKAFDKKGDHNAAIAEYRTTLQLNPDFAKTHSFPALPPAAKTPEGVGGDASGSPPPVIHATPEQPVNKPVHIDGGVQAAKLIHRVEPTYPPVASQAHISGTVHLHAIITTDGRVHEVDVLSGNPVFARSAMDAAKQWRYQPTLLNGRPVAVDTTIDVVFALPPVTGSTTSTTGSSTQPGTPASAGNPSGNPQPAQATQTPAERSPCSFGKIEFTEDANRLVGKVPYTYQGNYPLSAVAIRGVPVDKERKLIPDLKYEQTSLQTASGTAYFAVEGHPRLNQQGQPEKESTYLVVAVVLKQNGATVCGEMVPYQRKW